MIVAGYEIGLAEVVFVIGVIALGGGIGLYKLPFSKKGLLIVSLLLCVGGAYGGGYLSSDTLPDRDTDGGTDTDLLVKDLNGMFNAKEEGSYNAVSGLLFRLYSGKDAKLEDVQAGRIQPFKIADAVTDSAGKAIFSDLDTDFYTLVFPGNEEAFDGTDYMGTSVTVNLEGVKETLNTRDAWFDPSTIYLKKIADVKYNISATGTSFSGGQDDNASVTEPASGSGTTVSVTIKAGTDKAWLTDSGYYCRLVLSTDAAMSENTQITLSDCRLGSSSSGGIIKKDLSGSYYVDVTSDIVLNTTLNRNDVFNFDLWVKDLGEVTTTADVLKITIQYSLVSKDSSGLIILQDAGVYIEITCANNS